MSIFKDKVLLITGGTGSFGNAVLRRFLASDIKEIRMIKQIMDEGMRLGIFQIHSTQWAAMMMLYSLKGLEAPYLKNNIGTYIRDHRHIIIKTLFDGMLAKPETK